MRKEEVLLRVVVSSSYKVCKSLRKKSLRFLTEFPMRNLYPSRATSINLGSQTMRFADFVWLKKKPVDTVGNFDVVLYVFHKEYLSRK